MFRYVRVYAVSLATCWPRYSKPAIAVPGPTARLFCQVSCGCRVVKKPGKAPLIFWSSVVEMGLAIAVEERGAQFIARAKALCQRGGDVGVAIAVAIGVVQPERNRRLR